MLVSSIIQRLKEKRTLFWQLLFVTLAFVLMVVSGSLYVSNMLQNHLSKQARDMLTQTRIEIESELVEPHTALTVISKTIQRMILEGNDADIVQKYISDIGVEMYNKKTGFEFDGIYGYFEGLGGVFLHSDGWEGDVDFNPVDRPWYKAGVEAGDNITVTPMYLNVRKNDYLVTYVRRIFDNEGQPLGVVCMEVPLDRIRNYVVNMQITKSGYGILMNEELVLIAHPSFELVGKHARDISPGFAMLARELEFGAEYFGRELENYRGQWSVTFSMRLENGWVLTLITPKAEYYKELQDMTIIIGVMGTLFGIVLLTILFRLDLAKSRSDEQNLQKSVLLAEMEKSREADELTQLMLNATPLGCKLWNKDHHIIACNQEILNLFELENKQELFDNFYGLSPEYQPCGKLSTDMGDELLKKAFKEGYCRFEWIHQKLNGEAIPSEINLVRVKHKGDYAVAGYIRDLREYKQMMKKIDQRDNLLNTVNKAAVVLLSTEEDRNMRISVLKGMELLGRTVEVDRVQIWQNEILEGSLHFVHKCEWLSEVGRQKKPIPLGIKFPYSAKPEWEIKFRQGEYINGPLADLSEGDREFLKPYDMNSIVIIPLFLQDRFWGFFSLDDCRNERTFSEEEINILRSGGLLIANAFLHSDMIKNIHSTTVQLENALKEAQDANTAKSKFLATMSHEIRTPMNVILGVTDSQLTSVNLTQEVTEAFEKIYDSGNMLLHIINDILDLSKIEAGKFEIMPTKYEALSLIYDAANMSVMKFGHKQIKFILQIDEKIPLNLYGDELRIKQILNNLISNAFKYTNEGEVVLSFAAESIASDIGKIMLILQVSDTGQGMTPEQVNKLFDEYTRFNLEANRTTVGTGLGMTITSNLVKMMDGMICVDSTPDVGTTFTIRIPQVVSGPGLLGREAAENFENFDFSNNDRERNKKIVRELMPYGKVLVVDDMKSNLDVARLLLSPYELQIDTAESGFDAIDIIKLGSEYDIVFMDHMMPKMDGVETVKRLRGLGYEQPIIALTASAVTGQREMFMANGFDGFISKPIDLRQLNDSLNKYVRDKERIRSKDTAGKKPVEEINKGNPNIPDTPVIEIPGVDAETGSALYGGNMQIYISVLRSFVNNALTVIEKLRNVTEETLPDYVINVHGLKGICAGIAAEKVRGEAYNLEMMGRANDLAGILAGNEALIKDAEDLTAGIKAWFDKQNIENQKPLLPCPDRNLLARLRECCDAFDMGGVDNAMDELESANYKTDAQLVTWLRERINESDFIAVVSKLVEYGEKPK